MAFQDEFDRIVGIEGRYSNNPKDSGGPTMFGITEVVARANGYHDDMQVMPLTVARTIYRRQYWDLMRLDAIAAISPAIAAELFDTGVNCGTGVAGRFLQRTVNVLNRQGKDYGDITVDGAIGPVTVHQVKAFIDKRGKQGEAALLRALNALQGSRYIELAEAREKDEEFVFGWLLNRVTI